MTERLGRGSSPLTVDELLEALADPRFNVRYEAIIAIARRAPDERLMNALIDVLNSGEPALGTMAAWALGRIGDENAIRPLREGLDAEYRSVRAHCARSLGTLRDEEAVSILNQYGSIAYAKGKSRELVSKAWKEIEPLLKKSHAKKQLKDLAFFLTEREF